MKVAITGMGCVSSIGLNVEENFQSLREERSGIQAARILSGFENLLTGEVKQSNAELISDSKLNHAIFSRTSLLGIKAAKEAWGANSHLPNLRTGLIGATSVGGMDRSEKYYRQVLEEKDADLSLILTHDSGNTTEKIAKELGISGYVNTLSTACSSSANAIMLGARLIQHGILDRVLVGGADALTAFTIKGFHSLMIYDEHWCKPFDEARNGLNLGEGAAFLLLESEKSLSITKNKSLAWVTGWNNSADAYHQTASSPDGKGATMAMQNALKNAGISNNAISYINAHGTGTKNNDLSESVAIKNVFGEKVPPFSSTKAFTGHTLAAAGGIEAVFSVLAIQHNFIPPNLNFANPISEMGLIPNLKSGSLIIENVLSNSFGFGGNNSSLVFSKN